MRPKCSWPKGDYILNDAYTQNKQLSMAAYAELEKRENQPLFSSVPNAAGLSGDQFNLDSESTPMAKSVPNV